MEVYNHYGDLMVLAERVCKLRNTQCTVELCAQLIRYEGQRVEVTDRYGHVRRFTVGRSTGWMPVHLELFRKGVKWGPAVTGYPFSTIRGV